MAIKLVTQSGFPKAVVMRVILERLRRHPFVHTHHKPLFVYRAFRRGYLRLLHSAR